MSDHRTRYSGPSLTDQHLHATDEQLRQVLDIESGLRDVLFEDRHAVLLAGLTQLLDLDAGISDILEPPYAATAGSGGIGPNSDPTGTFETAPELADQLQSAEHGGEQEPLDYLPSRRRPHDDSPPSSS